MLPAGQRSSMLYTSDNQKSIGKSLYSASSLPCYYKFLNNEVGIMFARNVVTQKVVVALPGVAKALSRFSPVMMQRVAIEYSLNRSFMTLIHAGELAFLHNKTIRIQVIDAALDFSVRLKNQRLTVQFPPQIEDVFFKANLGDLLLLMCGKADPDTLFFRRRLMISGDTELGLTLKNFLDRLDPQELLPHHLYACLTRLTDGFSQQQHTVVAH